MGLLFCVRSVVNRRVKTRIEAMGFSGVNYESDNSQLNGRKIFIRLDTLLDDNLIDDDRYILCNGILCDSFMRWIHPK